MPGMDGKTAIVTGGATLIGAAVVRGFRAAGANVAVADIDAEAGERLAAELGEGVLFLAHRHHATTPRSSASSRRPWKPSAGSTSSSTSPAPTSTRASSRRARTGSSR